MSLGLMLIHFATAKWFFLNLTKAEWVSELVYSSWKLMRSAKPVCSAKSVRAGANGRIVLKETD
jgi:hypothetical protein